jgi:predicted MFS family arabinose efflux permease
MSLLAGAMFGMFYLITQYLQDVLRYSPLQAGLAFLPFTAVMFLTVRTMPRLMHHFGTGPLIAIGSLLVAAGALWLSRVTSDGSYAVQVLGPLMVFGLGAGCAFMPLNASILATVPPEDSGAASGVLQTLQWAGGSVGVAGLVTVLGTADRDAGIAGGIGAALLGAGLFAAGALALAATRLALARRR